MADPLSLVALGAGLVSLGIQSAEGITKYLDALDCRKEEIASVQEQNSALKKLINLIESQLERPCIDSERKEYVRRCLGTCEKQLQALDRLVADLVKTEKPATEAPAAEKPAATEKPTARLKRKLKAQGALLRYPFSRDKIKQLEERLHRANEMLGLALQSLQMEKLTSLESTSQDIAANIYVVQRQVTGFQDSLERRVTGIHDSLERRVTGIHDTLERQATGFQDSLQPLQASLGKIESLLVRQMMAGHQAVHLSGSSTAESSKASRRDASKASANRLRGNPYGALRVAAARYDAVSSSGGASEQFHETFALLAGSSFACTCRPRLLRQRENSGWGPLAFFSETTAREHLPGCPAARIAVANRSRTVGVKYTGLKRFLNAAVEFSFAMTSGGGGWSLSPNFRYYPTVDEKTAPAFRIMELIFRLQRAPWPGQGATPQWHDEFVALALAKLVKLFKSGRASPLAVDSLNRTLIHRWAKCFVATDLSARNVALLEILRWLVVEFEVPTAAFDIEGHTPLSLMSAHHDGGQRSYVAATELLFRSTTEYSRAALHQPKLSRRVPSFISEGCRRRRLLGRSVKVAEAYECGPLSLAILADNQDEVDRLLKRHPATLSERNFFGQTPLHLAIGKPKYLRLLTRAAGAGSALLNEPDCYGWRPMEIALSLSGSHCRNGARRVRCRGCSCAESLTILLKANCAVSMVPSSLLKQASQRCRLRYVRHLKDRRERLKRLALDSLSAAESQHLRLMGEGVLDEFAPQVVQLLQRYRVQIPEALATGPRMELSGYWTVYQNFQDILDAELFFRFGFRDTGSIWRANHRPHEFYELPHLRWLAEHGADVLFDEVKPCGAGRGLFSAHYTFWQIGHDSERLLRRRAPYDALEPWVHELHTVLLSIDIADDCECGCSSGSCTPLIYLFKGLSFQSSDPERLAWRFSRYLEVFGTQYQLIHLSAALRFFTFEALKLPHRCCNSDLNLFDDSEDGSQTCSEDEDEIDDGYTHELTLLQEMLWEFEGDVATAFRDRGITGAIEFWRHCWVDRVKEALERLEGSELSPDEKREAEDIGIVWKQSEKKPTEVMVAPSQEAWENPYDIGTLNYWLYELDRIYSD